MPGIPCGVCAWLSSQNLPDAGVRKGEQWRTGNHRTSCAYYSGKCAHYVGVRRAPIGYTLDSAA